ncbi:hypothetical protein LBMAG52_23300 [Planctomycetia bacterium]|nr:hypothetical protein LBMAG52_23300 [Planctomycetia bacterium]
MSHPWLFSAKTDLLTFGGSAVVALLLVAVGWPLGWLESDTPGWLWIASVLLIDVAHVYATGFRVYFDRAELRRRAWLYWLVPLLAFGIGTALYSEGSRLFWRTLAYVAVFHFVRQQYGWVALYRAKAGERDGLGRAIDSAAIYLATIYPLVFWHSHSRRFSWFVSSDFVELPVLAERILAPIYWGALALYAARSAYRAIWLRQFNPGKDLVVATTALCWYVGIVGLNSDYAFTVTNVITHGVPYMVLVAKFQPGRSADPSAVAVERRPEWRWLRFVGVLWFLAYAEELLWDCGLWHDRSWLFGPAWNIGDWDQVLVPLLAVPQITHYVLDGFIWRRRSNQDVGEVLQLTRSVSEGECSK